MNDLFWWIRQGILIFAGLFFLLFGVYLLLAAYHLNNPEWFIMTFFASNLIILISGALLAGFFLRVWARVRGEGEKGE